MNVAKVNRRTHLGISWSGERW